jgi:hypothetical protein
VADEFAEARAAIATMEAQLLRLRGVIANVAERDRLLEEQQLKVSMVSADNDQKAAYLGRLIREREQHGPDAGPPPVESKS